MQRIDVALGDRSYPIWIGSGILKQIPKLFRFSDERKWIIITQQSIQHLLGNRLNKILDLAGLDVSIAIIPEGEEAKSLSQIEAIYHRLLDKNCDRSTVLIAFGGGVVGDVTGFVAATFMRGIDYFQVPTTLLAMVDSAIGGKTGVNLPEGKNLVGAFYQPKGVVVDTDLLFHLPEREIISAMAEIVKYGAIRDRDFLVHLNEQINSLLSLSNDTLITRAITRCCEIKADIVSQDERENNLRQILNFGHTVGHALETTLGYGILKHGEAVAYGMMAAGDISHALGYLNREDLDLLVTTIKNLPLPKLENLDTETLLEVIQHDKKVKAGKLHFVILEGLGNAMVTDQVSDKTLSYALEKL